jgi:hypothetical protein
MVALGPILTKNFSFWTGISAAAKGWRFNAAIACGRAGFLARARTEN